MEHDSTAEAVADDTPTMRSLIKPGSAVRQASDVPGRPYILRWTAHALAKVEILGIDRTRVERAVLESDHFRRPNSGAAAWRINAGRLVIVYEHPDQGDPSAARIVTVWRRR